MTGSQHVAVLANDDAASRRGTDANADGTGQHLAEYFHDLSLDRYQVFDIFWGRLFQSRSRSPFPGTFGFFSGSRKRRHHQAEREKARQIRRTPAKKEKSVRCHHKNPHKPVVMCCEQATTVTPLILTQMARVGIGLREAR